MTRNSCSYQSSHLCDTRTLLHFYWIAKLGSYAQAAQHLSITAPALSASLSALESELGVALLIRGGRRRTELTEAGAVLLGHVEEILQCLKDMREVA